RAAAAYGQAVASGEEQLYKEALEQHLRVLKRQSGHSGANFYAGMIYRKLGDTARAKTHLIKGTRFGILGNDANFYLGKIFGSEQKYKEAIAYLSKYSEKTEYEPGRLEAKKLIDEYATNLRARLGDTVKIDLKALGQADMQKEISTISPVPKYAPVEVVIDSFLSLSLVDTFSKPGQEMLAAAEAFRQQQYDQAINGMRTVASRYPHDDVAVRCLYNMGICHFYLKNYPDAQRIFQQLLEKHPSHSLAAASLFLAATTCLQRHEPQQAEKLYRLFLMNHRNHRWTAAAYERLGDAYADLMDYKKAVDSYSACVKLSENPVVLMKLADAYNTLNNGSRAVEYYKKALAAGRAAPHLEIMPVVTYKLADCLYRQKNYPQALATYQNAVKQFPAYQDTPWGLFQAASIHKNLGAYDKAAEMFTLLIQKFPQDYWAQQARWKLEDTVWEHEYKSVFNKGQVTY
ncbi:MAG: tetratricopeptide repeat protein, partial [Chitinivibrionales bacterium]|nr:tetratricopeptide repeat protein [Chitinivibrionales bacterium]